LLDRRDQKSVKGPTIVSRDFPAGTKYKVEDKSATVIKNAGKTQRSIQETMGSKLSGEIAAKIAAEAGFTALVPSGKLSSELQSKISSELTSAVQVTLTDEQSYEVQRTKEVLQGIEYQLPDDGKSRGELTLEFYLNHWPWSWEFYLCRTRYLRLRYSEGWFSTERTTIASGQTDPGLPLFQIKFYEPQETYSFTTSGHKPDLTDERANEYVIEPLIGKPRTFRPPEGPDMEELARLAFPKTSAERARAQTTVAGSRTGTGARSTRSESGVKAARSTRKSPRRSPVAEISRLRRSYLPRRPVLFMARASRA